MSFCLSFCLAVGPSIGYKLDLAPPTRPTQHNSLENAGGLSRLGSIILIHVNLLMFGGATGCAAAAWHYAMAISDLFGPHWCCIMPCSCSTALPYAIGCPTIQRRVSMARRCLSALCLPPPSPRLPSYTQPFPTAIIHPRAYEVPH